MKNYGKKSELVLVEWEDSRQPRSEWQYAKDIVLQNPTPVKCVSVGWVAYQDNNVISLAPNMGDIDPDDEDETFTQVSGVITIPIACVKKITPLEEMGS